MLSPLLRLEDLPGPMSMHMLEQSGIAHPLGNGDAYLEDDAGSLYGRALIIRGMLPGQLTAVCARSAAWVWVGGEMPGSLDALTEQHFRSRPYGRQIRRFTRHVNDCHMTTIGGLSLTSPARTVCDLATLGHEEVLSGRIVDTAAAIMDTYHITTGTCARILQENKFLHNAHQAFAILRMLGERRPDSCDSVYTMLQLRHMDIDARERFTTTA